MTVKVRRLAVAVSVLLGVVSGVPAEAGERVPHPSRSAPSADVRFLRCVIAHESGGDPNAENGGRWGGSTASGLFQFLDSTWRGNAKWVPEARKYQRASDAPGWVQWLVALHSVKQGGHSNWAGTSCGYGT